MTFLFFGQATTSAAHPAPAAGACNPVGFPPSAPGYREMYLVAWWEMTWESWNDWWFYGDSMVIIMVILWPKFQVKTWKRRFFEHIFQTGIWFMIQLCPCRCALEKLGSWWWCHGSRSGARFGEDFQDQAAPDPQKRDSQNWKNIPNTLANRTKHLGYLPANAN